MSLCDRFGHLWLWPWQKHRRCLFCGRLESIAIGEHSITTRPIVDSAHVDVIRWSEDGVPLAPGDLGMDTDTGRPVAYVAGAARPLERQHPTEMYINNTAALNGERLRVTDGAVLFDGSTGGNPFDSFSSATNGFVWIPEKAAIRAGVATSIYWGSAQVGLYSAAFGQYARASGQGSYAAGCYAWGSGSYSAAFGYDSRAYGYGSCSFGMYNRSNERYSATFGRYAVATRYNEMACSGWYVNAIGDTANCHFILSNQTVGEESKELFLDGTAGGPFRLTVPVGGALAFRGDVCVRTVGSTYKEAGAYYFEGIIKNDDGTTSLVSSVTPTLIGKDAGLDISLTVEADDTNDSLKITGINNESSSPRTIIWACHLWAAQAIG